ncbi:M1 family metallopeptidase [Streptomyces varsoviensis]|uniref:M1 family metallopeptidase n=1 Tax=Streptomyces varsoviensis TaxID=67373 RepID=UPI0005615C82|nr:M1 family metallopeptidase [Streptomyces varsoviensis]
MRTPHRFALLGALVGSLALSTGPASAAIGGSGVGDPYYPDDGNSGYRVSHYDVRVGYDPARTRYLDGDTTVTAKATEDLDRFSLDLKGFTVASVDIDGAPAKSFSRSGEHKLDITPGRRLAKGKKFTVRVRYAGKPVGGAWNTMKDGGAYVSGEPHSSRDWYPSNDHPSNKATFQLTATVPDGWTAIGSGLPGKTTTGESADGKATKTFRWREDSPVATYLTAFAVDKFTVHHSKLKDGTPVIHAYSPGTEAASQKWEGLLPDILDFFSSKFGPYPFSSAGGIVVSGGDGDGPGALETQTRPTYDGSMFDMSMTHEDAHQWFGDSVTVADWRNGCLNECFAQYASQLWEEHKGADIDGYFYHDTVEEQKNNPEYWGVKLYDPGKGRELDPALYDKGSLMIHALRRTVGDKAFFATLKQWTHDHRGSNATWPQFEKLAQKVSGKDLTGFFNAWVHSTKIPEKKYLYPGSLAKLTK